jgi:hypothetical protein
MIEIQESSPKWLLFVAVCPVGTRSVMFVRCPISDIKIHTPHNLFSILIIVLALPMS